MIHSGHDTSFVYLGHDAIVVCYSWARIDATREQPAERHANIETCLWDSTARELTDKEFTAYETKIMRAIG